MNIVLNGESRETPQGCTILELLHAAGVDPARVAVELDGAIVRRAAWGETRLEPGARLEVVHFVGGG